MPGYRIVLAPSAQRQLEQLRGSALVGLRGVILALADEPRPPGTVKLSGRHDLWRVRVHIDGRGWRIVYHLRERERLVIVTRVPPRDEGTDRSL